MPEPSRLIAFEQLPAMAQGSKVRFLACVHSYDPKTARLMLEDRQAGSNNWASINVENVLENVSHELLEVGAWINIIGTIRSAQPRSSKKVACPTIDATMIWSAGAIKLEEYRAAVEAYQGAISTQSVS